jgi:hypothetical protein
MTTDTSIKLPRFHVNADTPGSALIAAVRGSARLTAALPADELTPLIAAHGAATAAVKEARDLPSGDVDVSGEADAAFQQGATLDVAGLLTRVTTAQAARDGRALLVRLLSDLPSQYEREMQSVILSDLTAFYAALTRDLDTLLDKGTEAANALAGISTAEQAIDAGRVDEWSLLRTLWHDYAQLRVEHRALLSHESQSFTNSSTNLGFAFFDGIAEVIPDYHKIVNGKMQHLDGRPLRVELPWPALDPSKFEHFRITVMRRDDLRPHVATAAEAFASSTRVPAPPTPGASTADLGLTIQPGSREAEWTMTRIKDAGVKRDDDVRNGRIDPDY